MTSRLKILPLITVCLVCLSGSLMSASGLQAWFVDSLIKVFPNNAAGSHHLSSPEFVAARNQHVNIQISLRSNAEVKGITAAVTPLHDDAGHTIDAATVRQEGYVVVGSHTHSPPDDLIGTAPGWYPDVLLPLPLTLKANWTTSLWIEVHIPANASPGTYRGAVQIQSGSRTLARLPFQLQVFAATVPEQRSLHVTNWFSLGDEVSRQFFGVPVFSDGWWTLVGNVARVFAEHRQNVVLTPLMDLITAHDDGGRIEYDFSNFDRWVRTFQQAGVIGTIEGSHLTTRAQGSYNGALMVPIIQLAGNQAQEIDVPAADARVEPFLSSFLSQLYNHLKENGWANHYVQHISDEPHGDEIPFYVKFAGIVHHVMPGIQTIDAVDIARIPESLKQSCDIWVPILSSFDNYVNLINQRTQSGHAVWYYTCIVPQGQYLNRFIDFPLVKTRLLLWQDFRYGLTGFLHWGGNDWTPEPMLDTQPVINSNQTLLPAGDAFIYYPDRKDLTFYSSIRMETFLTGIEDYELLANLKKSNPSEAARLAHTAVPSFKDYVRDVNTFRKIELELLQAASSTSTGG